MQTSFFQRIELVFWNTIINLFSRDSVLRRILHHLVHLWHKVRNHHAYSAILVAAALGYILGLILAQILPH